MAILTDRLWSLCKSANQEFYAFHRHWRSFRRARKYRKKAGTLKLHLACGEVYKASWVNIDLYNPRADLHLDLTRPLPFPDHSCQEIYSEHFLEHLDYPQQALIFLKELYRVSVQGGKVVTGVPDSYWPMQSYLQGANAPYFQMAREKNWHPMDNPTPMEQINYHFFQKGEHRFAYDEETLVKLLQQAGFQKVFLRDYTPETDSKWRQPGTLYAVAQK